MNFDDGMNFEILLNKATKNHNNNKIRIIQTHGEYIYVLKKSIIFCNADIVCLLLGSINTEKEAKAAGEGCF